MKEFFKNSYGKVVLAAGKVICPTDNFMHPKHCPIDSKFGKYEDDNVTNCLA